MEKPMYEKLFIGGDLSGIQKFLYNISSKKAAVSLKGRSAYLSDFMRGVYEELKNKLQGAVEDIYCSGGKFYLQAADTEDNRLAIECMAREKAVELWKEHRGALGLSIRYVPFTENADGTLYVEGENHEKVGILWKTISELFYRDKQQRLKNHLVGNYSAFFEPFELEGSPKVCIVTGIESPDCRLRDFGDEKRYVLPSVWEQIKKGEELRKSEGIEEFETYAKDTYLGILRMDVDGLGKRFADPGFESIIAYKQFSDQLTNFFEEELKTIQQKEYRKNLCLIYAGGDDVFAVGRWNKIIDFAERIHNEVNTRFAKDGLSISGGVVIVKPKYPIAKAAEKAGDAEEAAKHFHNGEKNAFSLFGRTVSWNGEFDVVKKYKDMFQNLVKTNGLDRSLLHKVMLYASIAEKNIQRKNEGKPLDYSYYWHASYYLARFAKRNEKNEKVKDLCDKLRTRVMTDVRKLQLVALGARWAELLLRMENKKEDNNQ
ncbi:MAG: hypothetical protein IKH52_03750 [Bacteroidaceae bacterium]|nr:hypothetical protein [Bacteroidaceae bacterium]